MYKYYTLSNGLKIVTEYIEHVNSISIGVMVQNGSRNEPENLNGISHFIEHMFFKGTTKRTSKEIVEEIENIGGQINAYTSKEATCYYTKTLDTHFDLSLDVLSDMLLNSKFDPEEIEKEKGVVVEEINMSEDSPEDVLEDLHAKAMFGDNPLAYPILGTIEKVRSFTRENLVDYIDNHYTPKNSVISICGKFDEKEIIKYVEKYFGEWNCKKEIIVEYKTPILLDDKLYADKQIEQLHVGLGLKSVAYGDKLSPGMLVLNNILGGGASSILFQKVREELGLCYTIYSYLHPYQGVGVLNIYAGLNKQFGEKALTVIETELNNLVNNGVSSRELDINKEKIKASYILGLESTSSRMFANAKSLLFRGRVRLQSEVLENISKITNDDIGLLLNETIKGGIISAAYVGNNVDYNNLNNIVNKSRIAYDNSSQNGKFNI
ncbi:MAG: pitrilysin family protein [Clostridium sp.]